MLVADDEEAIRSLVCAALHRAGHQSFAAANGLEAVALFRSNRDHIALVITDMMMPVMNGAEAIARIRDTDAAVPVICMTGYFNQPMPDGVHLLKKPFTIRSLLDLVRQVLPLAGT